MSVSTVLKSRRSRTATGGTSAANSLRTDDDRGGPGGEPGLQSLPWRQIDIVANTGGKSLKDVRRLLRRVGDGQAQHPCFVFRVQALGRCRHEKPGRPFAFDYLRHEPNFCLFDSFVSKASFREQRPD